jgi:Family of unknown function (DUF6463)
MSLTGNLLFATGVLHSGVGFMIPELAEPFWRIVHDGGRIKTLDIHERYARRATFWFQITGCVMMMLGYYIRHIALLLKKHKARQLDEALDEEVPTFLGYALTIIGSVGVFCMPTSGFPLVLAQGLRVLWIQYSRNGSIENKKF